MGREGSLSYHNYTVIRGLNSDGSLNIAPFNTSKGHWGPILTRIPKWIDRIKLSVVISLWRFWSCMNNEWYGISNLLGFYRTPWRIFNIFQDHFAGYQKCWSVIFSTGNLMWKIQGMHRIVYNIEKLSQMTVKFNFYLIYLIEALANECNLIFTWYWKFIIKSINQNWSTSLYAFFNTTLLSPIAVL